MSNHPSGVLVDEMYPAKKIGAPHPSSLHGLVYVQKKLLLLLKHRCVQKIQIDIGYHQGSSRGNLRLIARRAAKRD